MKTNQSKTSSFFGVTYVPSRNRWLVRIAVNGKRYYLGSFKSREEAEETYRCAYAMGGDKVIAWCNRDPQDRGPLIPPHRPVSEYADVEEKLKRFTCFKESLDVW